MKKRIIILIFLFWLFCPFAVKADHMYNVSMNIDILEDGSANITEIWRVKADSGTEWYKQLYNLGNSELSNFKVTMDDNMLTYKEWNIDESLDQKSGYYGINYTSSGLELCFGKGDFQEHTFTLSYKLSNYIFNVDDAQVLYWTLMPNVTVDYFSVVVSSYYDFPDTLDVWGYGYKGYAYVQDGKIKMSSEDSLYNDYVVLLVKFPVDTFKNTNTYSEYSSFDDVLGLAEEGTYEYDYEEYDYSSDSVFDKIFGFIFEIFIMLLFPVISVVAFVSASNNGYGYIGNKIIDKKNVPMFRDIPCNKDIYYANALIKLNNFGYKESNILGAIILKWIREDKIGFRNTTTGVFNKETSSIDLTRNPVFNNEKEQKLFNIMYEASGDGILETKELEKWCRKNYSKFFNLFTSIESSKTNELKSNGHIFKRQNKEQCKKKNVMDDIIYQDSINLYGLKKYLEEFSRMDTKEVMEVKLWDEYLMFAYLFGIADKVAKQLKKLYPQVLEQNNMDLDTIMYVNMLSTRSVSAASSARSAAQSYSGGGGGFSSGGGGGGSFGGGGSMGGR